MLRIKYFKRNIIISSFLVITFLPTLVHASIFDFFKIDKKLAPGVYALPPAGNDIIGTSQIIIAKPGDTFSTISKRYDITVSELQIANPHISPKHIPTGTKILVASARILPPTKYRTGIVINIPELRLFYFAPDNTVMSFPVALGRKGWRTPLGTTIVVRKTIHPNWYPPQSIRDHYQQKTGKVLPKVIPAGKGNPLGDYAIYLKLPNYLIHGTNDPHSIGRLVSSGCIRMYNEDIAHLYQLVTPGTPVHIIYYPIKAGWKDNQLYLEAYSPVHHIKGFYQANVLKLNQVIAEAGANNITLKLNIAEINKILKQQNGDPQIISQP